MTDTGKSYANDWYAHLADDALGGLAAEELPPEVLRAPRPPVPELAEQETD